MESNMINRIDDLQVFTGYGKDELELISGYFSVKKFRAGELVTGSDEIRRELYIVLSGRVISTLKFSGSADRKHLECTRGDVFGEMSIFAGKPGFDSYTSAEESELLVITGESFRELIEQSPECSIKLISNLLSHSINQLRKSSRFLADVVEWGEKASRRVITDDLTGLYNRAFLDDAIENFFNISLSNNKPLSFLMLDTDNFRTINELIGHDAGNGVIIEFAGIIRRIISRHGIMARYGGDEFSILLPETDLSSAKEIAEQIRRGVEEFDFSRHLCGHNVRITTSIGISSFPETATEINEFKQKADDSLYRAKESGRNRVMCMD